MTIIQRHIKIHPSLKFGIMQAKDERFIQRAEIAADIFDCQEANPF
jgi:hypothetical protein